MEKNYFYISLVTVLAVSTFVFGYLYLVERNDVEEIATTSVETSALTTSTEFVSDIATVDDHDNLEMENTLKELPIEELSKEELDGLLLMREEEKLAHDVYTTLYEVWGQRIFTNIARSEQSHTDSVAIVLEKYDIEDPVLSTTEIGVFENNDLQELYDQLVEQGSESLVDAFQVGATVEDLDIYDLDQLMVDTDNEDILTLYQNLLKGSRNHMRSFTRMLQRNGSDYTVAFISEEQYYEIINTPSENGVTYDSLGQ